MAGKKKKTNICTDKTKLRQLLEFCAEKFEKIRRYQITDSAISLAIQQLPKNTRIEDVLIKATLINSLYGTAIFDIIKISQHICNKNIDQKINNGEISVIDDIRTGHGIPADENRERNLYSFATKYISLHAPEKFPIYDGLVKRLLKDINSIHKFHNPSFTQNDLAAYHRLKSVIDSLIAFLNLKRDFRYKKIDQALWLYAKYLYKPDELKKDADDIKHKCKELGC